MVFRVGMLANLAHRAHLKDNLTRCVPAWTSWPNVARATVEVETGIEAVAGQAALGVTMARVDRLVDSIGAVETTNGPVGPFVFSLLQTM